MELQWLIDSIENPYLLTQNEDNLNRLIQRYPYFSAARALKAKSAQLEQNIDYSDLLKLAAVHSRNREALYEYIVLYTPSSTEPNTDTASDALEPPKTPPLSAEENDITEKTTTVESTSSHQQLLEKEILSHAVSATILKEAIPNTPLETKEQIPAQKETPPTPSLPEDTSLLDWLKYPKANPNLPQQSSTDLIESFIQKGDEKIHLSAEPEPTMVPIDRPKVDFFSPENIAKASLTDNEDFITETLADIYKKQGNFKKAISTYKKLSLKFPEKSNYFARLIEELKEN